MSEQFTDIYLLPGEHAAGDARCRIRTLLGSCVSITLWHPLLRVGAMSHFVLPGASPHPGQGLNGRYGEDALALMLQELQQLGAAAGDCQAKLFGGGAMFEPRRRHHDVGRKNGEAARGMLLAHGVKVVSESLFDACHRQIVFCVNNGEVWVRQGKPPEHHS